MFTMKKKRIMLAGTNKYLMIHLSAFIGYANQTSFFDTQYYFSDQVQV